MYNSSITIILLGKSLVVVNFFFKKRKDWIKIFVQTSMAQTTHLYCLGLGANSIKYNFSYIKHLRSDPNHFFLCQSFKERKESNFDKNHFFLCQSSHKKNLKKVSSFLNFKNKIRIQMCCNW